ncbi:cytochrome c oxidase subunit 6B2 [Contarinia nasturtii]|uniref:cytochrome c oxidase subunit 6B2 n=1 Tax=Contarinia nasturtii TaxID=265458 RepID=UPI0012D38C57|nr:cytochrome c oxidase subunit 6B2 [Contarinia nasturtii]
MGKEPTKEELEAQVPFCAPFDPRFPNTNQTKYCTQSFIDFYRCQKLRGTDYEPCYYFEKVFHNICPNSWVEKWQDQMANGTFPVKI